MRESRGARGVQFAGGAFLEDGATVGGTVPEFDSARVLRAGDVIRVIDGQAVYGMEDVREIIVSHDPGEVVTIGLVRAGRALQVRLKLGKYEDLRDGSGPSRETVEGAWRRRSERLSAVARLAPPLDAGVTRFINERSVAEAREGFRAMDAARQAELAAAGLDSGARPLSIVAGGEPRGGIWSSMTEYLPTQGNPNARRDRPDANNLRQALVDNIEMCEREIRVLEEDLRRPGQPPDQLEALRAKRALVMAQLDGLRSKVRAMDQVAGAER